MYDEYKHLNKDKNHNVCFDIEMLANMICDCNYGFNRFISAVINRYKKSTSTNEQKWAEELEKLMDSGLF